MNDAAIRVVIADDQELVRTGFRLVLDAQPGIEVAGEAADGTPPAWNSPGGRGPTCAWSTSGCRNWTASMSHGR